MTAVSNYCNNIQCIQSQISSKHRLRPAIAEGQHQQRQDAVDGYVRISRCMFIGQLCAAQHHAPANAYISAYLLLCGVQKI